MSPAESKDEEVSRRRFITLMGLGVGWGGVVAALGRTVYVSLCRLRAADGF